MYCQVITMFKQHINLIIWTKIIVHFAIGSNSYTANYLCNKLTINTLLLVPLFVYIAYVIQMILSLV